MAINGVCIEEVLPGSAAAVAGIMPCDRLLSINGHKVRDTIDLMFYSAAPEVKLKLARGAKLMDVGLNNEGASADLGIVLKPFAVRKCRNRCIFCFVRQLPGGLRKSLYLRDEDYRMSFLYGNYITLTCMSMEERMRVVEQRLSPLYISVHSTNTDIRNTMLGRPDAPDILKDLKFFASHRIKMHTQIVLCPGYNDGRELTRTINELYRFYPYVQSIAVVPVGLTAHRKKELRPVGPEEAKEAVKIIGGFQTRFSRRHGEHLVFAADELYIKAGMELPPLKDYDELSQIENGVGLVPQFLAQARKLKLKPPEKMKKVGIVTFCGSSFFPFLSGFGERLRKKGFDFRGYEIINHYFGSSVTVTGLLTGRDVLKALSGELQKDDILLIPDIVMKEGDELFLDNVSRQDVEAILGVRAIIIESTPSGIVEAIMKVSA
jgi:putative radical SAM enzyme (TIGR03279 family)